MGGTDQQAVFDQKLTRCPVQAPAGMRALIVKSGDVPIVPGYDQIEATGARIHVGRDSSAFRHCIDPT